MFLRRVRVHTILGAAALSTVAYNYETETNQLLEKSKAKLGVFVWGSNETGLISPNPEHVKEPTLLKYFDGKILNSISFAKTHAAAIDSSGNLLQWGHLNLLGSPTTTLKNKNLVEVVCSEDRVFALGKDGTVYQVSQGKQDGMGWTSSIQTKIALPQNRNWFERITDIKAGNNFVLGLTNHGRVFEYRLDAMNNYGLDDKSEWKDVDIKGPVRQIASGSHHALFLTDDGKVYSKGWNRFGQLALTDRDIGITIDSVRKLDLKEPCSLITAGGDTTFFVLNNGQVYSCGNGQYGQLGSGGFYHAQGSIKPVRLLSSLHEYNEKENRIVNIPIQDLQVSSSHCSAVLESPGYGRDVLLWGQKEGLCRIDGKQANTPTPEYSKSLFPSNQRLQLAPPFKVQGRTVQQSIALGPNITAVYFKCI